MPLVPAQTNIPGLCSGGDQLCFSLGLKVIQLSRCSHQPLLSDETRVRPCCGWNFDSAWLLLSSGNSQVFWLGREAKIHRKWSYYTALSSALEPVLPTHPGRTPCLKTWSRQTWALLSSLLKLPLHLVSADEKRGWLTLLLELCK